jgi:nucleosome binding factor SPN SPT16 subunit
VSAASDDNNLLQEGAIVCSIGTRYAFYCATIARTLFINPTKKQARLV